MTQYLILILTAFLYAGYNLFIKVSGDHVPVTANTTIMATIALQIAALATSTSFAIYLVAGGTVISGLSKPTFFWAILAGICIGGAEICYLYLFGHTGTGSAKLPTNVIIPFIVGATIVIVVIASVFIFREPLSLTQLLGAAFAILGLILIFVEHTTLTK